MDYEFYGNILACLFVVGAGVLIGAGIKANAGHSTWATKCLLFAGIGLFLSMGIFFLVMYLTDSYESRTSLILGGITGLSAVVFAIGMLAFCARFGATYRRISELEEIESALRAAVADSAAGLEKREDPSSL